MDGTLVNSPRVIAMKIKITSLILASTVLSGCAHSQKNFDDIGKFADRGDYMAVAVRSTVGVFIAGVVDVLSLGGTLTPEESEAAWAPVTTAAQSSAGATQNQQMMQQSMDLLTDSTSDTAAATQAADSSGGYDVSGFDASAYKPGGGCERNLSYLSSRLKKFKPALIDDVRNQILALDMIAMMGTINQQGISPEVAIQQTLQQADAYDQSARDALSTAEQVNVFGTTDVEFERAIKSGNISVGTCSGIHDSALCAAIVAKYGAIAARAAAANLMCFKRTNQWVL